MMNENLIGILSKRFRHFTEETVLGYESEDQPGLLSIGGSTYPVVLLKNDVFFFPARDGRPEEDGRSMKTKAPTGTRIVLVDEPDLDEIVVVEGEGDAFAMRTVGYTGIAIAGGVNNLLSSKTDAIANRKKIFGGKNVRILFDNDEPGRKGSVKAARQLLADGAERVAIVKLTAADDVEDWVETFEDPDDALRALTHLIGGASWDNDESLEQQESADDKEMDIVRTSSDRIYVTGDQVPRLLAMTYERAARRILLGRYGPVTEPKVASPGYGDQQSEIGDVTREWTLAPEHEIGGRLYVPDRTDAIREYLRYGTLYLPPPPVSPEDQLSSVALWKELRTFVERWVVVPPFAPDVMVAYALLTWRLEDAGFRHVPYLRFFGPPGAGKGRALDVMRQICWRAFSTHPTNLNLHRIIDFFGDITLVVDEFHVDAGRNDSQQMLIDTLCLGYDRSQPVARVSATKGGKGDEIKNFRLFGPKVFAGYGADEHEALARRSVTVEMRADAEVPFSMSPLGLPEEFYDEGERLRGQLLAWRGRKLMKGLPIPMDHPHAQALVDRSGMEVGQVFFPLLAMVPGSLDDVREVILSYSEGRRKAVRDTRAVTDDAFVLEAFVNAAVGLNGYVRDGIYLATPQSIEMELNDHGLSAAAIGRKLKSLGFGSIRPNSGPTGSRLRYYQLDPTDPHHQKILSRAGITLPASPQAQPFDSVAKDAAL